VRQKTKRPGFASLMATAKDRRSLRILALFSGIVALAGCRSANEGTRSDRIGGDLVMISSAVKMYSINTRHPPTTAQGLGALVTEPVVGPKPKRWSRMLDRVPLDPWQTPYRYELLKPRATEWRWELRSAGPDGVFDTADDQASETECGRDRPAPGEGAPQEATPSF
jgi:general secretion pathway protein G